MNSTKAGKKGKPTLAELETLAVTARDLQEPWDVFLEHYGFDDEFIQSSQLTSDEMVESLVRQLVGQMLGNADAGIDDIVLTRAPGHALLHGTMLIEGRLVGILAFLESQVGLLSFPIEIAGTTFTRFSWEPVPRPAGTWIARPGRHDN